MKNAVSIGWTAVRDAGWALLAVLVFRRWAMAAGIRASLDHLIHFLGGVAIAYFLYRLIRMIAPWIGPVSPAARFVMAFTGACTVAVFWEFGEFASDRVFGTHIQYYVVETLWDLIFGVCGATMSLLVIGAIEAVRPRNLRVNSPSAAMEGSAPL